MTTKKNPYLDFYAEHNISPVANNVNLDLHFIQRKALYHHLGITPKCIEERNILEFGPGNGINALFTISMNPDQYILVDANPTGIKNCQKNLEHFFANKNWKVVDSLIDKFEINEKFDLVICEGLLPNQINPEQMAQYCGKFVKKGGLFTLTCHDMVSTLSETLRCLPGMLLIKNIDDFDEKVSILSDFYKPHLSHLKGMTRTNEEWVIDNILNAEFWQDAPLFSIEEAIDALYDDFEVHLTSPSFHSDWTWYKSIEDVKVHFNSLMIENYWRYMHSFIDWRVTSPPRQEIENKELSQLCRDIRTQVKNSLNDNSEINFLLENCQKLSDYLPDENLVTRHSLKSYIDGLNEYLVKGRINPEKFSSFGAWWGRGMQYISFIKT